MCVARRAADAADAFGVIVLQFWSIALSKVGSLLYRFVGYESTNIQHHPGRDGRIVPRIENFGKRIATWCHVVVGCAVVQTSFRKHVYRRRAARPRRSLAIAAAHGLTMSEICWSLMLESTVTISWFN